MKVVVQEWERVLVYRDGRFVGVLEPGRRTVPWLRHRTVRVTVRPRLLAVPLQEVLTADGIAVKVSLTSTVRVGDARAWHEAVEQPDAFLHSALQLALRDAVAGRTLDELLADRAEVPAQLRAGVAPTAARIGLEVDEVALRDVVVPAELRRAAAEVVTARAQGLAALERARTEVAVTRALANAATLVGSHPGLLQLRTLQAVEAGGATVVLSADPAVARAVATGG